MTGATSRCSGSTWPGPGTPRARRSARPVNGQGGPLSYGAAHHRWKKYCIAAGAETGIHQLRHAHATELINSGVSIEVVRRRLGHAPTETTQVYALLADKVADAEIHAARRRRDQTAAR
jgi:integrase/recombinase XerD